MGAGAERLASQLEEVLSAKESYTAEVGRLKGERARIAEEINGLKARISEAIADQEKVVAILNELAAEEDQLEGEGENPSEAGSL